MKLYVVRHGQTQWNVENKINGVTDIPLTSQGHIQAQQLADKIRDYPIDIIISSPLIRARQTAQHILKVLPKNVEMVVDNRLKEQDFGVYEARDRKDIDFINNKQQFAVKCPNGESIAQVIYRVYNLIEEIKNRHSNKNILLVCHGGVCRAIKTYFTDVTAIEYATYSPNNADIVEYDLSLK